MHKGDDDDNNSRDTPNVETEMQDCTSNNWSHWNSNEKLKEKFIAARGKHSIDSLQKTAMEHHI